MFRVIAVDNEESALQRFRSIAADIPELSAQGEFLQPGEALRYIKEHPVDAVFINIEMPEGKGPELAKKITEVDPYVSIVFVAVHDQYALEAFRAHAVGYLLKPLQRFEMEELATFLACHVVRRQEKRTAYPLRIQCFGTFSIVMEAEAPFEVRWKTAKAEELFALLVYHQGKPKTKDVLINALWQGVETQKAINRFRVTCTYLRTTLENMGFPNLVERSAAGYRLNINAVDCDLYRFRKAARSVTTCGEEALRQASALYGGEFMEKQAYLWASAARADLQAYYQKIQYRLADMALARGQTENACAALEQILRMEACDEDTVSRMIQIKLQAGDRAGAERAYQTYKRELRKELGVMPPAAIRSLMEPVPDGKR